MCGECGEDGRQIDHLSYQESTKSSPQIPVHKWAPIGRASAVKEQGRNRRGIRVFASVFVRTVDCPVGPIHRDKTNEDATGQGEVGNWSLEAISQHGVVPPRVLTTEREARHGGYAV